MESPMNDLTVQRKEFTDQLVASGLLIPMGVPGLYGRGADFEEVVQRFEDLVGAFLRTDGAERRVFPPVIPRSTLERAGYMESMPQLCGCIHSFTGNELEQRKLIKKIEDGEEWAETLAPTDLALAPAGCYPLYPTLRGTLPRGGLLVDMGAAYVFRREPSDDPARLQAFRTREVVRVGEPDVVLPWRQLWLERGLELLSSLGLDVRTEEAHDPFFGRGGRMRAASQLEQRLKFELQVPVCSEEHPTAVASFNYHRTHFGDVFEIKSEDGEAAHSACLGFGIERVALALFKKHGLTHTKWPQSVRERLWGS